MPRRYRGDTAEMPRRYRRDAVEMPRRSRASRSARGFGRAWLASLRRNDATEFDGEGAVQDFVEKMCNPLKPEGEWVAKIDLVEVR